MVKRRHCCPDLPAKRRRIDPAQSSQRRLVLYTPSNELLRCLGLFLRRRCYKLDLSPTQAIGWLRNIDNYLLITGYQPVSFLSSGSVVFLYMLCRDLISPDADSVEQLQVSVLTCYFITHCYTGNENGYPETPFLVGSRTAFWDRCLSYINIMSSKMMQINSNRQVYSETFPELKAESARKVVRKLLLKSEFFMGALWDKGEGEFIYCCRLEQIGFGLLYLNPIRLKTLFTISPL
ncbi:cyclin-dependent kinase 5 activator 1-like [Bufo gargarizans]|uniref:cyclin-dependent kinase 5 activator 1-like n=1 Tax=Bufo gargarizans TaxID=30331 RepID=UPI001CF28BA2|nr:cyclin-dependent kinase 5 activator 1-like [Bufo gargarizans]